MFRFAIVSGIALFSVVAANAGQIQIGGANGLTPSTVSTAGCLSGAGCTEQGFVATLFQSAPVSPQVSGTLPAPAGEGGSGVNFSLISNGPGNNFWDLPTGTAGTSLTIPIGIFGVTDVWTMINDIESTSS